MDKGAPALDLKHIGGGLAARATAHHVFDARLRDDTLVIPIVEVANVGIQRLLVDANRTLQADR